MGKGLSLYGEGGGVAELDVGEGVHVQALVEGQGLLGTEVGVIVAHLADGPVVQGGALEGKAGAEVNEDPKVAYCYPRSVLGAEVPGRDHRVHDAPGGREPHRDALVRAVQRTGLGQCDVGEDGAQGVGGGIAADEGGFAVAEVVVGDLDVPVVTINGPEAYEVSRSGPLFPPGADVEIGNDGPSDTIPDDADRFGPPR